MDATITVIKKQAIVDKAREYLGTPFHHQGRLKGVGIDCAGLCACVGRELGFPIKDHTIYARLPDPMALLRTVRANCRQIVSGAAEPGDLLVFWIKHPDRPQHLAIKTAKGMIHTHAGVGRVVETSIDAFWRKRLYGAVSFKGAE